MQWREDTRYLLENWGKYREVEESRRRLDEDFTAMLEDIGRDLRRRDPWRDTAWQVDVTDGLWLRKESWPKTPSKDDWLCVGLYAPSIEAVMTANGSRWYSNLWAPTGTAKPKDLERALKPIIEGSDDWSAWELDHAEQGPLWHYLPTLDGKALVEGEFHRLVQREFEQLAKLVPVIDEIVSAGR